MKTIIEKGFGGHDAGKAGLYVSEGFVQATVSYPLAEVVAPATQALDKALDKVKAAIPGTLDDTVIDKLKVAYHKELAEIFGQI